MSPEEAEDLILSAENTEIEYARDEWERINKKKPKNGNKPNKLVFMGEEEFLGDNILLQLLKVTDSEKLRSYIKQLYGKLQRRLDKFDLTVQEYYNILKKQNFQCAICKDELTSDVIDHNHTTGEVRGIICKTCNGGLIPFDEYEQRPWFTYRKVIYTVSKEHPPSSPLRECRYLKNPVESFRMHNFEIEEYDDIQELKRRISAMDKNEITIYIKEQFHEGRGQMYGRYIWANKIGIVRIIRYLKGTLSD